MLRRRVMTLERALAIRDEYAGANEFKAWFRPLLANIEALDLAEELHVLYEQGLVQSQRAQEVMERLAILHEDATSNT